MEENNWYVYRHLKPNGEVFYIGIGNQNKFKRAYDSSKSRRSQYWINKVKKYPNYEVQILTTKLSKEVASEIETTLILWYGREDLSKGTLVNLTDGGDGMENYKHTDSYKKNLSKRVSGENNPMYGKKKELHHLYGVPCTEEKKKKISESNKGKVVKEETKELWRKHRKGGGNSRAKLVICLETGIFYDCAKDAAKALGLNEDSIYSWLNNKNLNKTSLIYV